jgi:hypothetical protein
MRYLLRASFLPVAMLAPAALSTAAPAGEIVGQVVPAEGVKAVFAVQRLKNTMTEIRRNDCPGEIDPQTGKFTIRNLEDGVYDILLVTPKGKIEGVDMKVEAETPELLTPQDVTDLKSKIEKMDEFMNRKKALVIEGNHKQAKALMDLCRDRVHHMGNDLIWRIEIWQFENLTGSWQLQGQGRKGRTTLYRVKAPKEELDNLSYVFEPRLGGIRVAGDQPVELPKYQIPEDWPAHPGSAPVKYPPERKAP